MNSKNDRHNEILEILKHSPYVTVEHLSQKLHISPSSIRRDLSVLEARGSVIRSYGGVSLACSNHQNVSFAMRMKANPAAKRKIAEKAMDLVNDGNVVFLDGSTTAMYLAYKLVNKTGVTVITNGLHIAHYLSEFKMKVICTGGSLDVEDRSLMVGSETIRAIRDMRADLAFVTTNAIDRDGILFDYTREGVAVVQQMLESAATKVCLCDSSKVGKTSTFRECSLSDLDAVVCDIPLGEIYGEAFPNTKFL